MMKLSRILLGLVVSLSVATSALAEPTHITVRVISKGAKFVGTSMGGVLVTIKDAQTGALLAKGVTRGGTGDTKRIMILDRKRGIPISTAGAAKFQATIDIEEPRLVEVMAYGPLAQRQSANRVSATQWIVPGKHITGGDAWMIQLPGFVVDVQAPPTHVKIEGLPRRIGIKANVIMM